LELCLIDRTGDVDHEDRHVRERDLSDVRLFCVLRQVGPSPADAIAGELQRLFDDGFRFELQVDDTYAFGTRTRDGLDVLDAGQLVLERNGDQGFYVLGRNTRIRGSHRDERDLDVWCCLTGQTHVRKPAKDGNAQHH